MRSEPTVQITVYDATRTVRGRAEGDLRLSLPPGLFRVHFERGGAVHTEIVDHEDATDLEHAGPPLQSPIPLAGAATSHDYFIDPARRFSTEDTGPPLGDAPHASRLFVFIRRAERDAEPREVPSEPLAIHDVNGRFLATISPDNAVLDAHDGYAAFSSRVAPGTYRLRVARSRRDVAITIPAGRAAHVFVADPGIVRLDDLRASLVPASARFDPESALALAMESVIAVLRTSGRTVPASARALLPDAAEDDLCFGIAAAHLLWRCQDRAAFAEVLQRLARHRQLPDIAILEQIDQATPRASSDGGPAPRAGAPVALDVPPLFRASLAMLMIRPELDSSGVPPGSALAQAAKTSFHDSIWCTWSARPWDERWIDPAVESLREQDRDPDAASIARRLALPAQTVEETLRRLDATMPVGNRRRLDIGGAIVPGYHLEEVLGRGVQSTVFRATRNGDPRRVALKIVRLNGGANHCERVLRRLALVERTGHPALVEPSAWGSLLGDAGIWLETELCRGSLLDLVSETDTPLQLPEAFLIFREATACLAHLHRRELLHGDLKPGNLLVRNDGKVAIGDLGLARCLVHPHTATGAPRFAPPELLTGAEQSLPASDVWSLAATFYFLLTLELPRDEYAEQSQLHAALANPIVPIALRRPDLPPALARCIDRALSPMSIHRPRDGDALREALLWVDLRAADQGPPAAARPVRGELRPGAADREREPRLAEGSNPPGHREPAAAPPPQVIQQLDRRSPPPPRAVERSIRRVLLVDDEEHILAGYQRGFGRRHIVFPALDAGTARAIAKREPCDLAVVDLRLKGESGIALTRDLKRACPGILVALCSGYLSVETAVAAVRAGADVVLFKPVTAREILRRIEQRPREEPGLGETPTLERAEWEHITRVLADCKGDLSMAARLLGIYRGTLRRRLRRFAPRA